MRIITAFFQPSSVMKKVTKPISLKKSFRPCSKSKSAAIIGAATNKKSKSRLINFFISLINCETLLVQFYKSLSTLNLSTSLNKNCFNGTCKLRSNVILHLHSFHQENGVAYVDGVTYF